MGVFFKAVKNPKTKAGMYGANILLALDQLGGSVLGIHHDETISSHLGKCERGDYDFPWWGKPVARLLNRTDPGHCINAIEADEGFKNGRLFRRKKT
jgi:hypothetical protein